jgi:pimeloyl-ACP methyl ester carboxylesterase
MAEPAPIELGGFPGIHAEADGERRPFPLLLLHGVLFDHHDFTTYCRYFSWRGYDCFALARRGRAGVPPDNAVGVRLRDYMEDTVRVMEAIGRRPAVIGHSLGALLAQKAAEEDSCAAIVLMAPTPPRGVAARPPASALPFYLKAVPPTPAAAGRGAPGRVPVHGRGSTPGPLRADGPGVGTGAP